ncbi:uncharacterized protein LOC118750127 [Rhagoletis pomonella]|uniref:uncharacterized protein LOC118750127 n=1 Tax=Rhagoletis pomonella TaxID=28610 RepID=UPI00177C6275|nr:uncharacterized protein LOC118750127 [Rhagoletis pomonella]
MPTDQDVTLGDTPRPQNSFLKRKCDAIFRQIVTIQRQSTNEALQAMDHAELSTRIELLDHILGNFEAAQTGLKEENPDELDSSSRTDFLAIYVSIKAAITRELKSQRIEPHAHSPTALPTFAGAFTEWPNFISMFQTVVDNKPELTKIEKFQHLRSCLKGSALDVIRSLEIRESNYDKAMNLLKSRFDNKRLIFQAHIRELFELKSAEANTVGSLRVLVDKFTSHIRALQTLGSKIHIADCLLILIMSQKLDPSTQTKWEESAACSNIPTWESMETFLEKRGQTLESINFATVQNTPSAKTCPSFIKLTAAIRRKEAKKANLCLNCLKHGHQAQQCKSSNCRRCLSQHHTLLHFIPAQQSTTDCTPDEKPESAAQATTLVSKSNNISPDPSLTENVLIATAVILVKNSTGSFIPCRAVLDSASQLNFVTSRFANQVDLKMSKFSYSVSGIGESDLKISHCASITFKSMHNDYSTSITFAVTPTST